MAGHQVVKLRLPAEVVEQIKAREDCPPEAGPGRTGGVSLWLRRLVLRELGAEAPVDPHAEQAARFRQASQDKALALLGAMQTVTEATALAEAAGLELQARIVPQGTPTPWNIPPED